MKRKVTISPSCRIVSASANLVVTSGSDRTGFTEEEIYLIEGQCDEAYDNYPEYRDDVSSLVSIVWEHVSWLKNELDDVSGTISESSVSDYAYQYFDRQYGI